MGKKIFIEQAINIALKSAESAGGPFGAVIVKDGKVISTGYNRVTENNDPTAHAEVVAIREACEKLGTFDLSDCEIYASCEPCPMCFSAIYWARMKQVYFAADHNDAKAAGFDDAFIYNEISLAPEFRSIPFNKVDHKAFNAPFKAWGNNQHKTAY